MKFEGSIIINKDKETVSKLYVDPKHLGEYQDGFVSKDLVSGSLNAEGSKSKIMYKYGIDRNGYR